LSPLERANLITGPSSFHGTQQIMCPYPHLKMETSIFTDVVFVFPSTPSKISGRATPLPVNRDVYALVTCSGSQRPSRCKRGAEMLFVLRSDFHLLAFAGRSDIDERLTAL
jgi:hypothetical protein